ncbi:MAG: hypothetical protein ACKO7P_14075 [Bacteroidota bacterium]
MINTITFDKTCRELIIPFQRTSIREMFIENLALFNLPYNIKIIVSVEHDPCNTEWMAKFLMEKSTKQKFHIALNADWVEWFAPKNKRQVSVVNRTILHEIIHGLDILTLEDSRRKHLTNFESVRLLLDEGKFDFYWALMYFFTLLRDEGLALYGESLLLGDDGEKSETELKEWVEHDLEWMLCAMEQNQAERAALDEIFSRVYDYGAYIFKVLFFEERNGKNATAHLLDLMNMDLSHWIWLFFKRLFPHQVHRILMHYSDRNLLWFGVFVPPGTALISDPKSLLLDYFMEANINPLSRDNFLLIRERLVNSMTEEGTSWKSDHYEHDLHLMVHQRIVRIWDSLDDELQGFALAYFINSNDQLHDELTFIGHLDDMLLLDYLEQYCCCKR